MSVFDPNTEVESLELRVALRNATQERRRASLSYNGVTAREALEQRVALLRAARQPGAEGLVTPPPRSRPVRVAASIPPASSAASITPHTQEAHVVGTQDPSTPNGPLLHPESSPPPQHERPAPDSAHPQHAEYVRLSPFYKEHIGGFHNYLFLKRRGQLDSTMQGIEEGWERDQEKLRIREAARARHRDLQDPRRTQSPASSPKGPS